MLNTIPERKEVVESPESILIFGFPGVGKTYAYEHQDELGVTLQDSDSSHFHWLYKDNEFKDPVLDEDGNKVPDPTWPNNYLQYVELTGKEQIVKPKYIMLSTHEEVMNIMKQANFKLAITVVPDRKDKDYFLDLYRQRGSSESFIELLDKNWETWIDDSMKRAFLNSYSIIIVGKNRAYKNIYDLIKADPMSRMAMEFDD